LIKEIQPVNLSRIKKIYKILSHPPA